MDSTHYWQPVIVRNDRQFITGKEVKPGPCLTDTTRLPDSIYGQALDTFVIACADIIPVYANQMFIGLRSREPQPDWWCFGGRICKGELFQIAAARNAKRELFHNSDEVEINPSRFSLVGVYNLIWDKRAQEPIDNGCHTVSITMMLPLTDTEVASLHPNEEYCATCWISPDEVIHKPGFYHPCLLQMARDTARLITLTKP